MFTLKLLRKIGKILRGGATTREITLGFMLGMMWGLIPGFNLAQFLMLFLVLLLNANFGFMLMGLLVGTLACYGLSPLTFEIGYVLISSLQGLFTSLHNTAVVAWVGLDSYCLVGGVPLGIIAGGAIRSVCEVLGIQDVVAKSLGSANPHNVLKACINGLRSQSSPKLLSAIRGKKISDIVLKREAK